MALDTRDKRAAAWGLGLYALMLGPTPDAAIDSAEDRLHVYGFARIEPATSWDFPTTGSPTIAAGASPRIVAAGSHRLRAG